MEASRMLDTFKEALYEGYVINLDNYAECTEECSKCLAKEACDYLANQEGGFNANFDKLIRPLLEEERWTTISFNLIGKYAINRIDYIEFDKLMKLALKNDNLTDGYIDGKWRFFQSSMLSYMISMPEFVAEVKNKIREVNYKG